MSKHLQKFKNKIIQGLQSIFMDLKNFHTYLPHPEQHTNTFPSLLLQFPKYQLVGLFEEN